MKKVMVIMRKVDRKNIVGREDNTRKKNKVDVGKRRKNPALILDCGKIAKISNTADD